MEKVSEESSNIQRGKQFMRQLGIQQSTWKQFRRVIFLFWWHRNEGSCNRIFTK